MKNITLLFLILPFLGLGQVQIGQDIHGESNGDQSGWSVSLSSNGNIVAIGAPRNEAFSGHVRVYENVSGVWTQIGQDIDGELFNDQSGRSLSLSSDGSIVAIGAPSNSDINGNFSGHVRVYENISGVWTQIGEDIDGNSANDRFGSSVSLSSDGNVLAIGAINDGTGGNFPGIVRIYENISGVWTQIGLDIIGEASNDDFGTSVSLSSNGSVVAVGAVRNNSFSGHVRVYENISGVWTQIGEDIDGEAVGDESGYKISLSSDGNIVAISSEKNSSFGLSSGRGHVRVYENISGVWTQIGDDIDGEEVGESSGSGVSLSSDGTIVAIGARNNNSGFGASGDVRVYKFNGTNWVQIGIDIPGESLNEQSGWDVSLSSDGSIVAIGAIGNGVTGLDPGNVRIFSIASELAVLEVVDDINGNLNSINVTAAQLNSISGVSGAIDGVNYTTALDNGTYADENSPTALEIQFIIDLVNASLGLEENSLFNFKLYPNPAKTQFTIQLDPSVQLDKISIYNSLGQEVLTSKAYTVDTSKLSSGSYVVEVTTNQGKSTKQLIID